MVKSFFIVLCSAIFSSCVGQTTLKDGTKVPSSSHKFVNKKKFTSKSYNEIDINYFYELECTYNSDYNFDPIDEIYPAKWIKVLQFYPDGQIREFAKEYSDENTDTTGNRGVIYSKRNGVYIDFYGAVSNGSMQIITHKIKTQGDKIYMFENLC